MTRKLFIANPNATNSELDAKVVVNNYKLNSSQLDEVAEQYSEIVLDRMNTRDLEEFVYESLIDRFSKMSQTELRDHIIELENSGDPTDNLFDELAENVTLSELMKEVK
tara:strand:- start:1025 stop:1351 length:327 start_codon:yes stop_codon:yes gene_type:complete